MNLIKNKNKNKKTSFSLRWHIRRSRPAPCVHETGFFGRYLSAMFSADFAQYGYHITWNSYKDIFNITYHLIQKWLITILVSLGTTCRPIVFNAIPQQPLCYQSNFILFIQYEYNVWSYWIIHKIHWVYSLDTWSWLITWLDVDLTDRIEYPMYFFLNVILLITYVWIRDNPY